ncbi:MAG: hypothetical protein LBG90_02205 [Spirochaetaceae bacterium]|nr:hypothetical protein [Spirochaetaceae bacterium]
MNHPLKTFVFRDLYAPFSSLSGLGLAIIASGRLAFGLTTAAALLWVYAGTITVRYFARPVYPVIGGRVPLIFIAGFWGSGFLLFLWFYSPLLAFQASFSLMLIPCYCVGSPLFAVPMPEGKASAPVFKKILQKASLEAGGLGLIILALSLIREPIGYMSLSLPGGTQGIVELFPPLEDPSFLPLRIISESAGGFLLLGYAGALFHSAKKSIQKNRGQE